MKPAPRVLSVPERNGHTRLLDAVLAARDLTPGDLTPAAMHGTAHLIHDMPRAVELIADAIGRGLPIAIYGDYDVDGGTAAALLYRGLSRSDAVVLRPYVPQRDEGYGITRLGIDRLAAQGAKVIITVDNGTNAREAVRYAKSLGITVIVTDHHPAHDDTVAFPDALVNPQLPGEYPFAYLAGAGVAFHVLLALNDSGAIPEIRDLISYAAVGTVADVMPMAQANRLLVSTGLQEQRIRQHVGLGALYDFVTRNEYQQRNPLLSRGRVSAQKVAFEIAPRLNAAGRMGSPELALRLLLTEDPLEAEVLAHELDAINSERKEVQRRCQAEAEVKVAALDDSMRTVCVADARWRHGIVGPVAARLAETYARPVYIGAVDEVGVVHGSARTGCPGVSCAAILEGAKRLLNAEALAAGASESELPLKGGGHDAAAGFTVAFRDWERFTEAIEQAAADVMRESVIKTVVPVDAVWTLPSWHEIQEVISAMEPFGKAGYDEPVVLVTDCTVRDKVYSRRNPASNYCRVTLVNGEQGAARVLEATAFDKLAGIDPGDRLARVALRLTADGVRVEEVIKDMPGAEL